MPTILDEINIKEFDRTIVDKLKHSSGGEVMYTQTQIAADAAERWAAARFQGFGWKYIHVGTSSEAHDGLVEIYEGSYVTRFSVEVKHEGAIELSGGGTAIRYTNSNISRWYREFWSKDPCLLVIFHFPDHDTHRVGEHGGLWRFVSWLPTGPREGMNSIDIPLENTLDSIVGKERIRFIMSKLGTKPTYGWDLPRLRQEFEVAGDWLGVAAVHLGQANTEAAAAAILNSAERDPKAFHIGGTIFLERARYREAEIAFRTVIACEKISPQMIAEALINASTAIRKQGGDIEAKKFLAEASDKVNSSLVDYAIGMIYHRRSQWMKALTKFDDAIEKDRLNKRPMGIHMNRAQSGIVYLDMGNYAKARELLSGALVDLSALPDQPPIVKRWIGHCNRSLGFCDVFTDKLEDAHKHFAEAEDNYQQAQFLFQIPSVTFGKALLEFKLNSITVAWELIVKALADSAEKGAPGYCAEMLVAKSLIADSLGNDTDSIECLRDVITKSGPGDSNAKGIAIALYRLGMKLLNNRPAEDNADEGLTYLEIAIGMKRSVGFVDYSEIDSDYAKVSPNITVEIQRAANLEISRLVGLWGRN
jgi:tetratricopeptide (TPR) repeat protein